MARKKNFLIYSFMAYIRNFRFQGSQIKNADFFAQLPNESKFAKFNFTNKNVVKLARKKNFLYIRKGLIQENFSFGPF